MSVVRYENERVVRMLHSTSQFRHMFCKHAQQTEQYHQVQHGGSGGQEHNPLRLSAKCTYWGLPWDREGAVAVFPVAKLGAVSNPPSVFLQEDGVVDLDFHPFDDSVIASCGTNEVHLWEIPEGGLTDEEVEDAKMTFDGSDKRLTSLQWHPFAAGVLVLTDGGRRVKFFDAFAGEEKACIEEGHGGLITCLTWSPDGGMMASHCKDKVLRIWDPRGNKLVSEIKDHEGNKAQRCVWMGERNTITTVGFNKGMMREIHVYDVRNMDGILSTTTLDQSTSSLLPHWDDDLGLLYLTGKGDGNIRVFEWVGEESKYYQVSEYKSGQPTSGIVVWPKTEMDVRKCEVMRMFKLAGKDVIPLTWNVPRQAASFQFQDDIFPETRGHEPACDADAWFGGADATLSKVSLKPEKY